LHLTLANLQTWECPSQGPLSSLFLCTKNADYQHLTLDIWVEINVNLTSKSKFEPMYKLCNVTLNHEWSNKSKICRKTLT
jgi:hypothetical protein